MNTGQLADVFRLLRAYGLFVVLVQPGGEEQPDRINAFVTDLVAMGILNDSDSNSAAELIRASLVDVRQCDPEEEWQKLRDSRTFGVRHLQTPSANHNT